MHDAAGGLATGWRRGDYTFGRSRSVSFFDPTFAPSGKTAVTCVLPTYNFEFWVDLQQRDPAQYQAEKHRVAEAVIPILERRVADIRQAIEVVDVSTPATVIRYTGNWKGSMEGWLLTPSTDFRPFRGTPPRAALEPTAVLLRSIAAAQRWRSASSLSTVC
jgi:phytoene dehydrogenase-like protein